MAQFVETYYDCDYLDSKGIICEEIGEDDFHNNNQLFAEMVATCLILELSDPTF